MCGERPQRRRDEPQEHLMTSQRVLIGAAFCAVTIIGFGSSASAGEWAPGGGKNGHTTPIWGHDTANSVCAFNGADQPDTGDNPEEHYGDPGDDGYWATTPAGSNSNGKAMVQSGGQGIAAVANAAPGAIAGGSGGFGEACNPNSGFEE
jgi:hypothetical protein